MPITEIDVDQLESLDPHAIQLIDVREPDEFVEARVPGAQLIPLATVPDYVDELDQSTTVYLICAVGGRSMHVAEWLDAQGFDTVNVAGGTKGWVAAGKTFDSGPADA